MEAAIGESQFQVYYEDTDFTGYVYHANYLRFFERAREDLFGVERIKQLFEAGCHLVVKSLELEYHRPAKHADQLVIKSSTEPKGFTQLTCWQEAYRKSDGLMEKMVSAKLNLVAVNGEGRPRRLPELSQASTLPS